MEITNPFMAYAEVPSIAKEIGYQMKTTYWGDFRVCGYNETAIRDTYRRSLSLAHEDKTYGTELALVLNWLCWYYAENNEKVAKIYQELWQDLDGWIIDNWKGDMLKYYLRETD